MVKVKLNNESGAHSAETCALPDSGSTSTLCTTSLLEKLGSQGQVTSLNLATLESDGRMLKTATQKLQVSDANGQNGFTAEAYNLWSVRMPRHCIISLDDINAWEHLRDLDIPVATDGQVQMLIGQDQPDVLMPPPPLRPERLENLEHPMLSGRSSGGQ